MAINKRLRYFRTEEEYQEFYEQQKQACDDGTLELLETTVCCITHGDTDTPDEYLPSHEPGDENVIMHYNANDDIRYIPFINPMWTIRGVYLSEVSGSGYQPIVATKSMVTLPDVIDGNQITKLGGTDFVRYLNTFPTFNIKNISVFEYVSRYDFDVPSDWPSLTELSVSQTQKVSGISAASAPKFHNGVLNAANLKTVSYSFTPISGSRMPHLLQDIPFINSSNVISLVIQLWDEVIDVQTVLLSTENLKSLSLQGGFSFTTVPYSTHTLVLKYDGDDLYWGSAGLNGINTNGKVVFDIRNNIKNIRLINLYIHDSDFSISTFSNINIPESLYFTNCYNSSATSTQKTDWLLTSGNIIRIEAPAHDLRFTNCQFKDYIIDIDNISSSSRYITFGFQPTGLSENITINFNTNNQTVNIQGSGEQVNSININVDDTVDNIGSLYVYFTANTLNITDNKIVANNLSFYHDIPVSTKLDWYCPNVSTSGKTLLFSQTSRVLKMFRYHGGYPNVTITDVLDSLDLVVTGYQYYSSEWVSLGLNIQEEVLASNIEFQESKNGLYVLSVKFAPNISVQTVNRILTSVNPAFDLKQYSSSASKTLEIYRTQYDEIEQNFPDILTIINKFGTIDIITI